MRSIKLFVVAALAAILVLSLTPLPNVSAVTLPNVDSIVMDGGPTQCVGGACNQGSDPTLSDEAPGGIIGPPPPYDPSTGVLGPLIVDVPHQVGGVPVGHNDGVHSYVITIKWSPGIFDPHVVGGFADITSWVVSGSPPDTLTITAKSVLRVIDSGIPTCPCNFWVAGFMVFFSSAAGGPPFASPVSLQDGMMVSFQAESFNIQPGASPGVLLISVTGYAGQTSGFFKLFMPATLPATFGRTLDDVAITVDGTSAASLTATDNLPVVDKGAGWLPGRLWSFNVQFSTRTIMSNPNPSPASVSPVGGTFITANKLALVAPYLALLGVIAAIAVVVVAPWKRREH